MRRSANPLLVAIGTAVAIAGVFVANLIPRHFIEIFSGFGTELPWLSRVFVQGGGFLWGLPLLVPALSSFVRVRGAGDNRRGLVALSLGIAIGVALPAVCVIAMSLPMFGLASSVDGG